MRGVSTCLVFLLAFAALSFADGSNGSISGVVFYNNSGTPVAVPNANVTLDPIIPGDGNQTALTDGNGSYSFINLNYSDIGIPYSISARYQENTSQPAIVNLTSAASGQLQNIIFNPAPPGGNDSGTDGSIYGYVFYNGNLAPANVTLSNQSATIAVNITGDNGFYNFTGLSYPDTYSIAFVPLANSNANQSMGNIGLSAQNHLVAQNLTINSGGECGAYSISGYVLNPEGSPIIDSLDVNAYGEGMGSSNKSQNGTYTLSCLANGTWYVGAGGPGYQWQTTNTTINGSSNTSINITLSRMQGGPGQGCGGNASIYGYIKGNNSGTLVNLSNTNVYAGIANNMGGPGMGGGNFCGGGTQTDNTGFYNISGLTAGTFMLNVMPEYGSGYQEVHLGPDSWITLGANNTQYARNFTLAKNGFIYGCVLGNNSGTLVELEFAAVNVYESTPGGAWGWAQTDASGCFNLSIAPGNGFGININPPYGSGYSSYRAGPEDGSASINVSSGATTVLSNVTLRLGARITGYVLNSTGSGLQWVSVNAHPRMMGPGGPGMGGGNDWGFANTDENGSFTIAGLSENNTYVLEAFPDPQSDYSSGRAEVVLSGSLARANITLSSGSRVSGTVTCEGSPVQYANINIFSNQGKGNGPMMESMDSGTFAFAMTDNNGQYTARGLLPGNYSLRVEIWNGQINCSNTLETVEVLSGTTLHNVTMAQAAIISGFVRDASNNSTIAYAGIDAFIPSGGMDGGGPMGNSAFTSTGADGSYTLRLSPSNSPYIVHVQPPWGSTYAGQERAVLVNSSGATTSLNFSLSSGGIIRGKVVDSNGTAVQFAFVNAFSENARSFGFASTSSDGTFDVRGLSAASDYNIFIQPSFTSSTYGTVVPTFVEDVEVSEGGTTDLGTITASTADSSLAVTITNNASAIANLNVHAWKPFTPFFGYCSTNASGQCEINGLLSGSYDVFIEPTGSRPPVFRSAQVDGATAFSFDYTTDLGSLYDITGTVSNGTNSVAYADVGIFSETAHFGTHAFADGSGQFTLYGVPAGNYTINADSQGYYHYMSSLEVSASREFNITLSTVDLANSYAVNGYLISSSGASVATKTIAIVDANNATLFSAFNVTDANGYYSVGGVPASTYKVTAVIGNQTYTSGATAVNANTQVNVTVS